MVVETLRTISPWIFTIELKKVPQGLDLNIMALFLPNLVDLKVKYSDGSVGEYRKQTYGMKYADAANLC